MDVLIAGCGYVGERLGLRLAGAGHVAWGLRRRPAGLPSPIRPVAADLLAPDLAERLPPVDAVVYAASADEPSEPAYRRAYVEGVRTLLDALDGGASRPLRRFLFLSSTAVYGDAGGAWVDEDTHPGPEGFRGERVLEGEALVRDRAGGTVLRLGGIYGPGRTRLVDRVRSGEAGCPGDTVWTNRIHRDDAAGAAAHLLELPDLGPAYVAVDREPASLCDVYRFVAALLGAPEPRVDPGLSRSRGSKRCSSRRLVASGYRFRYPTYREGYRALLEEEARPESE